MASMPTNKRNIYESENKESVLPKVAVLAPGSSGEMANQIHTRFKTEKAAYIANIIIHSPVQRAAALASIGPKNDEMALMN